MYPSFKNYLLFNDKQKNPPQKKAAKRLSLLKYTRRNKTEIIPARRQAYKDVFVQVTYFKYPRVITN